jgi:oligopeptide/dipeptide ABC transporter ATP-binding protein
MNAQMRAEMETGAPVGDSAREDVLIEARGLRKHFVTKRPLFGKPTVVRAVDGVDLSVRRGETFSIVGESGCGKSTLARLLIRLLDPTEGSVVYDGEDIAALPEGEMRRLRRDLQFVFQDPFSSLNPRMTIGGLVEEPMRAHGIHDPKQRREEVARLLRRVGLRPEYADRYPHEFSGGQRQRIGIARALATGPKLLIGDEPVSALDVSVQAQVINLLEDLKEEFGLTLIVIAHDLAVVRHMSDRVGVMYLGELVEVGEAEDFFAAPLHPYSRALLAAIPAPDPARRHDGARPTLTGDIPNPVAPPPGCRFHTRCPFADARCRTKRPVLRPAGEGRAVACHHFETLEPAEGLPPPPTRNPHVEKRFALYRARRSEQTPPRGNPEGATPEEKSPIRPGAHTAPAR